MKGRITQERTWVVCCTGMIVTILWATLFFWMRSIPPMTVQRFYTTSAHLRPTGFFSDELENNEPVNLRRSRIESSLTRQSPTTELGFLDNYPKFLTADAISKTWRFDDANHNPVRAQLIFDRGRAVWTLVHLTRNRNKKPDWTRTVKWHAGPEGMSQQYVSSLGRFQLDKSLCYYPPTVSAALIFYDGKRRQLFRLDFETQTVTPGSIMPLEERVVQMGILQKNSELIRPPI